MHNSVTTHNVTALPPNPLPTIIGVARTAGASSGSEYQEISLTLRS